MFKLVERDICEIGIEHIVIATLSMIKVEIIEDGIPSIAIGSDSYLITILRLNY